MRAIGRWSLAALVINSIIGSGIFGLPSDVARLIGRASPWAVLLAGAAAGVIMACFAEVASQFTQAGGPYLYARAAFGRFVGIEVGWMLWLVRLAAPAATANLFVIYCGEFWPHAREPLPRFLILTFLYGALTLINYRGVRASAQVSNVFTVAKLVPLFLVAIAGSFYLLAGHMAAPVLPGSAGAGAWLKACLLLVFAYGGFETALTPLSEAKNPRQDAAFALFTALITCTLLYSAIQWTVVGVLPDPAHSERPLADVARIVLGHGGAVFVSVGALISVVGYLSANMLGVPRITFALAENGDFPSIFAAIHPRFRTPYVSIRCVCALELAAGAAGKFHLECDTFRSGASSLLRPGLRRIAGISPPAAGSRAVSPSRRNPVRDPRSWDLRSIDHGREPERVVDPACDRAGGIAELGAGTSASSVRATLARAIPEL